MRNVVFAGILLFGGCWVKEESPGTPCKGLRACRVDDFGLYSRHASYWRFPIVEYDTTLPSGKYLDYWILDSIIMINWGSKATGDIGTMVSERTPGWAPHYYWCEFENYIGARYSCGSPCWSLISVMEDIVVDTNRGYILANGCPNENQDYCLLDLNTQKHHPITLPGLRVDRTMMDAIDAADFTNEGLHIRWRRECNYGSGFEPVDTVIAL